MPVRLSKEEVVTIRVLADRGQTNCEIARTVGVTESTVRYHLKRAREGAEDGRQDKPFEAERYAAVIAAWYEARAGGKRPVNVTELYEHLVAEHGYEASYRSVLRYVRSSYPPPKRRTYRRVETPPGAQTQTDWGDFTGVDIGCGPQRISALAMRLSHSRKPAVVWSESKDLLSWLSCHNGGFKRLGGVAATNRIDNVKTAIVQGAGPTGVIHPAYRAYARSLGFHIDACNARDPEAKGKAEATVRLIRLLGDPARRAWDGLEELQSVSDERLRRYCQRAICPATGLTVEESWQRELVRLRPLPPLLPEPFDIAVTRPVHKDCTVRFEQRSYTVPFAWVGRRVEVRGCAGTVQILAEGRVIQQYPRGTAERLLIDPSCYEGEATERVEPPRPLGKMASRLQAIYELPVEQRPVDLYAALAEVAR